MASEDIGQFYKTQVPGYEDSADIQAALRTYHYGNPIAPTDENLIEPFSIAGHFKALDNRVDFIEAEPARSIYSDTAPTGDHLVNGYIWVDSTSVTGNAPTYGTATYSASAPTSDLTAGTLWVDSDSTPLKLYVWSGSEWRVIGE